MPTCRVRMSQSHQARPLRPPDQAESSSTSVSRPREAQGPLWPRPSRGVPGERGAAETLPQCSPPHVHSATTPGGGETQAGKSNPFPSVNKSYAFAHASGGRRTGCPPPPRPNAVGPGGLGRRSSRGTKKRPRVPEDTAPGASWDQRRVRGSQRRSPGSSGRSQKQIQDWGPHPHASLPSPAGNRPGPGLRLPRDARGRALPPRTQHLHWRRSHGRTRGGGRTAAPQLPPSSQDPPSLLEATAQWKRAGPSLSPSLLNTVRVSTWFRPLFIGTQPGLGGFQESPAHGPWEAASHPDSFHP